MLLLDRSYLCNVLCNVCILCCTDEQRIYIDGDIAATNTGVDFPDFLAVDRDFRFGQRFHGENHH